MAAGRMDLEGDPNSYLQIKGWSEACCDLPSPLPCQHPPLIQALLRGGSLPQAISLPICSIQTHQSGCMAPDRGPVDIPPLLRQAAPQEGLLHMSA